jgi:hypothetical protein
MTPGITWQSASTVVAAHSRGVLVLHGHGDGCSSENPWSTGRLTMNGAPAVPDKGENEQC